MVSDGVTKEANGGNKTPTPMTIVVPGFGDNHDSLRVLERYLARSVGPTMTLSPQPSDGRARLEALAELLAMQIEYHQQKKQPINLVGFSMGGLICRYYCQFLAGTVQVQQLITIASPHQGTWSAYLFDCPACIQMRPGSQFLQSLNHDLTAFTTIRFTSVWTPLDLTIIPAVSSWLPVGEIVAILSPFHRTMVIDPRVQHAVSVRLMH